MPGSCRSARRPPRLPPRPATGVSPMTETVPKNLTASGLKPEKTSGVSMGWMSEASAVAAIEDCGANPSADWLAVLGRKLSWLRDATSAGQAPGAAWLLTASISAMGVMPAMGSLLN